MRQGRPHHQHGRRGRDSICFQCTRGKHTACVSIYCACPVEHIFENKGDD